MKRRTFVQAGTLAGVVGIASAPAFIKNAWAAAPGIKSDAIQLSSSAMTSGPLAAFGHGIVAGTEAALNQVNSNGGVHGKEVKVDFRDDAYNAQKSVENIKQFIKADETFAFFCCAGTPNNIATIPLMQQAGIPSVAPYTGSTAIRKPEYDQVFHVRASYSDEIKNLMQRITSMGLRDIGIAYLDNAFGKGQAGYARAELEKLNAEIVASVPIAIDGSNTLGAVKKLIAAQPSCVFLASAGAASAKIFAALKDNLVELPIITSSVGLTPASLKELGAKAAGTAVTRVVPDPQSLRMKLVRSFHRDMKLIGKADSISPISLESYINMRVMLRALEDAGSNPSREQFTMSLRSLRNWNMEGFNIDFTGKSPYVGSSYVDMGIISKSGRIV